MVTLSGFGKVLPPGEAGEEWEGPAEGGAVLQGPPQKTAQPGFPTVSLMFNGNQANGQEMEAPNSHHLAVHVIC